MQINICYRIFVKKITQNIKGTYSTCAGTLGVFLQSLKREHFTYSDLKIEILPIQRLVVMSLSKIKIIFSAILQIFGIELVSLEDKQKGTYILVNTLDTDVDEQLESDTNLTLTPVDWSDENHAKTGLLMVVLSAIFMNGEVMVDCTYLFKTHLMLSSQQGCNCQSILLTRSQQLSAVLRVLAQYPRSPGFKTQLRLDFSPPSVTLILELFEVSANLHFANISLCGTLLCDMFFVGKIKLRKVFL